MQARSCPVQLARVAVAINEFRPALACLFVVEPRSTPVHRPYFRTPFEPRGLCGCVKRSSSFIPTFTGLCTIMDPRGLLGDITLPTSLRLLHIDTEYRDELSFTSCFVEFLIHSLSTKRPVIVARLLLLDGVPCLYWVKVLLLNLTLYHGRTLPQTRLVWTLHSSFVNFPTFFVSITSAVICLLWSALEAGETNITERLSCESTNAGT